MNELQQKWREEFCARIECKDTPSARKELKR